MTLLRNHKGTRKGYRYFNLHNIDFVQNLRDIIYVEWKSFGVVLTIYDKIKPIIKNYLIFGNHEFSIDKIHSKKSRFIGLDAADYSFYSNALHDHDLMEIDLYFEKSNGQSNSYDCIIAFGKSQKNWLK